MQETETEVHIAELEQSAQVAEPVTAGVVDVEHAKNEFLYYPLDQISYRGSKVNFIHLAKPNARKLKANKVSISENVGVDQMENMISACIVRVVGDNDEEFASGDKRNIILELMFDDLLKLFNAVQERFLAALTG